MIDYNTLVIITRLCYESFLFSDDIYGDQTISINIGTEEELRQKVSFMKVRNELKVIK